MGFGAPSSEGGAEGGDGSRVGSMPPGFSGDELGGPGKAEFTQLVMNEDGLIDFVAIGARDSSSTPGVTLSHRSFDTRSV